MGLYGLTVQRGPWKTTAADVIRELDHPKVTTNANNNVFLRPIPMLMAPLQYGSVAPGPYAKPSVIQPGIAQSRPTLRPTFRTGGPATAPAPRGLAPATNVVAAGTAPAGSFPSLAGSTTSGSASSYATPSSISSLTSSNSSGGSTPTQMVDPNLDPQELADRLAQLVSGSEMSWSPSAAPSPSAWVEGPWDNPIPTHYVPEPKHVPVIPDDCIYVDCGITKSTTTTNFHTPAEYHTPEVYMDEEYTPMEWVDKLEPTPIPMEEQYKKLAQAEKIKKETLLGIKKQQGLSKKKLSKNPFSDLPSARHHLGRLKQKNAAGVKVEPDFEFIPPKILPDVKKPVVDTRFIPVQGMVPKPKVTIRKQKPKKHKSPDNELKRPSKVLRRQGNLVPPNIRTTGLPPSKQAQFPQKGVRRENDSLGRHFDDSIEMALNYQSKTRGSKRNSATVTPSQKKKKNPKKKK